MGFAMLGEGDFIRMQSEKPVGSSVRIDSHVETASLRISSRQKSGPGRGTDGGAGKKGRRREAFFRQPVNVRGLHLFCPIATDVRVAQVVGQHEDDVRLGFGQSDRGGKQDQHHNHEMDSG